MLHKFSVNLEHFFSPSLTLRVEWIAPREVSSAKNNVKTKQRPEMGSVKSDFDKNLHGQQLRA